MWKEVRERGDSLYYSRIWEEEGWSEMVKWGGPEDRKAVVNTYRMNSMQFKHAQTLFFNLMKLYSTTQQFD